MAAAFKSHNRINLSVQRGAGEGRGRGKDRINKETRGRKNKHAINNNND